MNAPRIINLFGRVPLLATILRWYANQFSEGSVVRIKHGLAADFLWRRHHCYVNGYWVGHYELPIQLAIGRELKSGDTFFDVGANAGFFTLVGARLVGPRGKCVAFDPSPENYQSICEQIELNKLIQCRAVAEAVADCEGTASFSFDSPGSSIGHLGTAKPGERETVVPVTTLDGASERFGEPCLVKVDIEGAELKALQGAPRLLSLVRPTWLVELHGEESQSAVTKTFWNCGYDLSSLDGRLLRDNDEIPRHIIARPKK